MFICMKWNSLFDRRMKIYYVAQVLKQVSNIRTVCPNYILEFRNTNSHLLQVYMGAWVKIEIVNENYVCYIIGHCYYSVQVLS